jgi:hypothetical protein
MGTNPAPRQGLEAVLKSVGASANVVLISGHPDPDAIGSALAHQRICEAMSESPATIANVLPVSHRQNRALVKLLNVDMLQVSSSRRPHARSSTCRSSTRRHPEPTIDLPADLKLLSGRRPPPLSDARGRPPPSSRCAPTSAPAALDLRGVHGPAGLAPLENAMPRGLTRRDRARVRHPDGHRTTSSLATSADFAAAAYVQGASATADVLKRVGRRTMATSASGMTVLGRALARTCSSCATSRSPASAYVSAGDRDSIATAADFILQPRGSSTPCVVFGIVEDRIDGSLRTDSASHRARHIPDRACSARTAPESPTAEGARTRAASRSRWVCSRSVKTKRPCGTSPSRSFAHASSKVMPDIEREYERQHPDPHNGHHHEESSSGRYSREF